MSGTYAESEVSAWLEANLPTWSLADGYLTRTYTTRGWQLTLLLANAIGYLAEAAWHHPELTLSYPQLTVRLQTHDAGGITDRPATAPSPTRTTPAYSRLQPPTAFQAGRPCSRRHRRQRSTLPGAPPAAR